MGVILRAFACAIFFYSCAFIWEHMEICSGFSCNPSVKEVEAFISSPVYKAELEKHFADKEAF